jgi:hypothetical protein
MDPIIQRFSASVICPCGGKNELLLPEVTCGTEMIWYLRCRGCGGFGWFHAAEENVFREAIQSVSKARNEPGGLSEEGTVEAHTLFAASLPPCGCGKSYSVVRWMEREPCLGCGQDLTGSPWPDPDREKQVSVRRISSTPSRS